MKSQNKLLLAALSMWMGISTSFTMDTPISIIKAQEAEDQQNRKTLKVILQNQLEKKPISSLLKAAPNHISKLIKNALNHSIERQYYVKEIQTTDQNVIDLLTAAYTEVEKILIKLGYPVTPSTLTNVNAALPKQLVLNNSVQPNPQIKQIKNALKVKKIIHPLPQAQQVPNNPLVVQVEPPLKMEYIIVPRNLDSKAIDEIEGIIGYHFKNKNLLIQALTTEEKNSARNYERYEYLGDKVLDAIIAELLLQEYPKVNPNMLTQARDALVSQEPMAALCIRLGLHEYLQDANQIIPLSSLCDIIESIVGTIYEDGGALAAQNFVLKFFIPMLKDKQCPEMNIAIVKKAAQTLHQDINYILQNQNCIITSKPGSGLVSKNLPPTNHITKKDHNRLKSYLAERYHIKNILPPTYQNSLIRLATDAEYQPLGADIPKLSLAWQEGLQINYRERFHNLMKILGKPNPEYISEEGKEGDLRFMCKIILDGNTINKFGPTKAIAQEKVSQDAYKHVQNGVILSTNLAQISNVAIELDNNNPVVSLNTFCQNHGLALPTYSQEKNIKNGIYTLISAPWLCTTIKGPSKAMVDLAQTEAAKKVIQLIKHLSTYHINPKKLSMINYCKHTNNATGTLIQFCEYFGLAKPSIATYYCEGLVTDPLQFKTTITMADKNMAKKPITGQKATTAAQAQHTAAQKALQCMINKMLKNEIKASSINA